MVPMEGIIVILRSSLLKINNAEQKLRRSYVDFRLGVYDERRKILLSQLPNIDYGILYVTAHKVNGDLPKAI